MSEFGSKHISLLRAAGDWVIRLAMFVVPVVSLAHEGWGMPVLTAAFVGILDGWARWWGACTARSFVLGPAGIELRSMFGVRVVRWELVTAIQSWHHINHIDCAAIHYRLAGRMHVATCSDCWREAELREFIAACASHVPQPIRIEVAGFCDRAVWLTLLRRLANDAMIAMVVGCAVGAPGTVTLLGLVASLCSGAFVALRYPFRSTTFVQRAGLWTQQSPAMRPLRTIPRPLRHWIRGLEEAAYRGRSVGS